MKREKRSQVDTKPRCIDTKSPVSQACLGPRGWLSWCFWAVVNGAYGVFSLFVRHSLVAKARKARKTQRYYARRAT